MFYTKRKQPYLWLFLCGKQDENHRTGGTTFGENFHKRVQSMVLWIILWLFEAMDGDLPFHLFPSPVV